MSDTTARVGVIIGTKAEPAAVDRYTASVQRMTGAIKELFASKNAATAGAAFGGSFAAAGLSVSSMVGKITEAIGGSSELASEMALVERRVGLTGEAFQVLARSGKVASEELIASFAKYRVKLGEALAGDKDARKIFSGLGLSPEELTKLPMERQMESLGVALGRFGDRNRQAAEAQAIFGRGYAAMIPVLEKLRTEGYDKLREKVSETAGVLSGDMASALGKAKKEANEAGAALATALAPTNLRLLKIKATITGALAENAGTIQSAGSGLGTGFLTAAVLSQLVARIGPQMNLIGSQASLAFSKGFGVGAAMLPSILGNALISPGALAGLAGIGRAIATPLGAALAVAVGGFLIAELERVALEKHAAFDAINERGVAEFRALRDKINAAASPEAAAGEQVTAAKLLAERQAALAVLEAKKQSFALDQLAAVAAARAGGRAGPPRALSETEEKQRAALEQQIPLLVSLVKYANDRGAAIAAANAAQRTANDQTFAEAAELEKTKLRRESLIEKEKQNRYEALTDDQSRLAFLGQWRAEEEAAAAAKLAGVKNSELRSDLELEARVKIADVDGKIAQLRHKIAEETDASARASAEEMNKILTQLDAGWRKDITRGLDSELHAIGIARAKAEGDFTKTAAQKWQAKQIAISDDMAATTKALTALQNRRAADVAQGVNPEGADADIQRAKDRLDELQMAHLQAGPNPTNWVEQTAAALTQLQDQWGTTAQQIGQSISGTIGGAVDSLAENITQAWLVTGDWNRALDNVEMAIGTEIVRAVLTMGARWVATQIMMAVAGKALAAASVAATTPVAAAQSAVWAAPATLATIASFGGAAAAAPAAIAGSIGLTQLLAAVPMFYEGGWTGAGGVVHDDEWVAPTWMAKDPALAGVFSELEGMRSGRGAMAPSAPGATAGLGASRKGVKIVTVIDDGSKASADEIDRLMTDPRTENHLVRVARKRRAEIGIQV